MGFHCQLGINHDSCIGKSSSQMKWGFLLYVLIKRPQLIFILGLFNKTRVWTYQSEPIGRLPRWLGGWNTSHQGGDGALFVQPAQRKFNGGYSALKDHRGSFFLISHKKKEQGNGPEWQQDKFLLKLIKNVFTGRVVKHWTKLPIRVVESASWKLFQTWLDKLQA